MDLREIPHRRYNPLTGEYLLVSPHRTKRPWQGKVEAVPRADMPAHDPSCYLCPGNRRAEGVRNPDYTETFVFTNDFAALLPGVEDARLNERDLLVAESEAGTCRVLCFSPRHDLTLAKMEASALVSVVRAWKEQYLDLGAEKDVNYVQIFENRGEIMGCSNPHPHGQIWANKHVPDLPLKEGERQAEWLKKKGRPLLVDYLEIEREKKERILFENEFFAALVPFWAVWPFETMILPKVRLPSLADFGPEHEAALADALSRMTRRYDRLFQVSFPYSMGLHQSPTDGREHPEWQFHIHFYPPLLRSATVKKFMVGYEMLAQAQRDLSAESAAERLRACSEEIL